jgi:integrase
MGYLSYNPFLSMDSANIRTYNEHKKTGKEKAFMLAEQPDIMKIAMDDYMSKPSPVPLGILLCFQLGLRVGELSALQWKDIDYDEKTIHICRYEEDETEFTEDFTNVKNYHYVIRENDLKGTFGERYVRLTEDAIYFLSLLKAYYDDNKINTPWLFWSAKENDKCHDRAFDLRIRKYCKQSGITEKSMHKIRATFCSNLARAGMPWDEIARQMGHNDIRTTQNNYAYNLESDETTQAIMEQSLCFFKKKVLKSTQTAV